MHDFDFDIEAALRTPLLFRCASGLDLTAQELAKLNALKLGYGRHHIWTPPVPKDSLPDAHIAVCHDINGMVRVEIDIASYDDHLEVIGLAYGNPGEGSGGWGGSCIPKGHLKNAIRLLHVESTQSLLPELA